MKRKRKQKCETSDKSAPPLPLPHVFDFSKRSHQAAFWMLLNSALYGKPENSLRGVKSKV